MAALTLTLAIAQVRRRLNEPTSNVTTDAQITEWLHRGARNVSALTLCLPIVETEAIADNQMKYALASDFIKIDAVTLSSTTGATDEVKGLQRINPWQIGHIAIATPGEPQFWTSWGVDGNLTTIGIYPTPNAAYGTTDPYVVTVHGYTAGADYGDGDVLPKWANNIAIWYAVSCAHTREGRHAKAALEIQKYLNMCNNSRRSLYSIHQIVDTADMRKLADVTITPQ